MAEEMKTIQSLNLKQVIKPNVCDYSGDIKVTGITADTNVTFKNCAPFRRCATHINEENFNTSKLCPCTI